MSRIPATGLRARRLAGAISDRPQRLPSGALLLSLALLLAAPAAADTYTEALAARQAGDYPRAIALLEETIDREPVNVDALFQLATVLAWNGRYADSIGKFERALALAPRHTDLRLGYARVLAWSGRLDDSEHQLRGLLSDDPANQDAAVTLGRVLTWRHDFSGADAVLQNLLARTPGNAEALIALGDLRRAEERYPEARLYYREAERIAPTAPELDGKLASLRGLGRWRLDAGAEYSSFSGGERSDWKGTDAVLRYALDRRTGIAFGAEWAERFELEDTQYTLALDRRFDTRVWGQLRVGVTPNADFWARRTIAGSGEFALQLDEKQHPVTRLLGDVRIATYGEHTAETFWLGMAQRLAHRFTATLKGVTTRNLNRDWTTGWLVRLDYEPDDTFRWHIGYADARESLETTVLDFTRDLRTRALFVGVYYGFTPSLGARLDLAHEWTRTIPDRTGCHAGVVTRF